MLIRHPSSLLRSSLLLLALSLPATGCALDVDEPEGEALGVAADAVLTCGGGSSAVFPCYNDNDNDGHGKGMAFFGCNCGSVSGTSRNNDDCNDGGVPVPVEIEVAALSPRPA